VPVLLKLYHTVCNLKKSKTKGITHIAPQVATAAAAALYVTEKGGHAAYRL